MFPCALGGKKQQDKTNPTKANPPALAAYLNYACSADLTSGKHWILPEQCHYEEKNE